MHNLSAKWGIVNGNDGLAFDFGTKSIGCAVVKASPARHSHCRHLKRKMLVPDWDAIGKTSSKNGSHGLVVGLPLNMDGTEQELTLRN